ncbi:HlyD family efflux transporter periplasmic adaptor subunit [uncultured Thiohalocapsa sp.]|uniref:HlyD family secretion protein n=1 Tax=uncultured Thiohalocapsa sp. TaxID=768990 RepID=UPI0025E2FAD7|nr:HlyD family efflux transporter periplasmic adaptor subunit [uncultured Thiohalocapsa sp.]
MSELRVVEEPFKNSAGITGDGDTRRGWRRLLLSLLIGVLLVAVSVPLWLWLDYRQNNVVSSNAWVRGRIAYMGVPVEGVVADVLVMDGEPVRNGQVIARLWDRDLQAQLASAHARLEQAGRELEVERLAIAQERRRLQSVAAKASAQLAAAEARADNAKERHEVLASLADAGATSREGIREAATERRAAAAEWEAAKAAHHSAMVDQEGLSVRESGIAVFESRMASARAEVAERQAALEKRLIRAPENGRVVRRLAEPGTSLDLGDPVLSLWLGDGVWIEAWVDEADLSDVKVGSTASVTVKSLPGRVLTGVVEAVSAAPDFTVPESDIPQPFHARMRNTPVFLVRIAMDDAAAHLVPGLSAVVGIRIADERLPQLASASAKRTVSQ